MGNGERQPDVLEQPMKSRSKLKVSVVSLVLINCLMAIVLKVAFDHSVVLDSLGETTDKIETALESGSLSKQKQNELLELYIESNKSKHSIMKYRNDLVFELSFLSLLNAIFCLVLLSLALKRID